MKRKIILYLLIIILLPVIVYADTCDNSNIVISNITKVDSNGYVVEINNPISNNQVINTNLKFFEVGDSITYSFTIKNNSREDYDLNKSISSDDYSDYEIISDNKMIKAGEEKTINLRITYKNKVDDSLFKGNKYIQNKELDIILGDEIKNPYTGLSRLIILLFIGLIIIYGLFEVLKEKKYLNLLVLLFIPVFVDAACQYKISINSSIEYNNVLPNLCTYNGELVQGVEFVNGQYTYRYMQEYYVNEDDDISEWNNMSIDGWGVTLTNKDLEDPVTTTLCSYINNKPIVSMQFMFKDSRAESIDFSGFDTSNVVNMSGMFDHSKTLLLDLSNFDTSKVTNMSRMFYKSFAHEIDTSSFTSDSLIDLNEMFIGSKSNYLDFRNFDFTRLSDFEEIDRGSNLEWMRFKDRDNVDIFLEHNSFCQAVPVYIGDDTEPLDFEFPLAIC